jgi:hypothetical protein
MEGEIPESEGKETEGGWWRITERLRRTLRP